MSRSELLKRFYQDVWIDGKLDEIDHYFAPDAKADGLFSRMQFGPEDFRDLITAASHLLGPLRIDCPVMVENGDWVAALIHVRTTRADNGAPIEVTGQTIVRFEDDRIAEAYNQFDFISFFEQLGQFPEDTLPVCLTGQRLDWV